ncbi:MAG: PEP-CTERM sorting domain-containing protein [Betaproteobacteria bacterium]|nr:PEP-CTERM sorting domain-containing protein [Betaproteobacteria bacterium]
MRSRLKNAVLATALACCAGGAMAAGSNDLDVSHDLATAPYFLFVAKDEGAFFDTFTFTFASGSLPATASFTIDELSLGSFTNIDWDDTAAATLSGGGLAAPMVLGEAGIDTAFSFSNVEVTASPIVLTLKGVADGTGIPGQISPGTYSIAAVAAPIPEPETFAMMLAGLGAIGFMAARRHRQG